MRNRLTSGATKTGITLATFRDLFESPNEEQKDSLDAFAELPERPERGAGF